jgi:hypothetical protein
LFFDRADLRADVAYAITMRYGDRRWLIDASSPAMR